MRGEYSGKTESGLDDHLVTLVLRRYDAAEIVFSALENPFHRAEGDLEILRQLALRDRLPLIAFMDALPGFKRWLHTLLNERL